MTFRLHQKATIIPGKFFYCEVVCQRVSRHELCRFLAHKLREFLLEFRDNSAIGVIVRLERLGRSYFVQ